MSTNSEMLTQTVAGKKRRYTHSADSANVKVRCNKNVAAGTGSKISTGSDGDSGCGSGDQSRNEKEIRCPKGSKNTVLQVSKTTALADKQTKHPSIDNANAFDTDFGRAYPRQQHKKNEDTSQNPKAICMVCVFVAAP